ncbi:cell growth-regulating nucleolar protein-like isoform X2 [Acropora muricata]|uniref:cell growth-regulating nucleolar protein-like isoform X2 n=1 Tax=Acropora muricata TaxID=159855 RepID=UPI0034E41886
MVSFCCNACGRTVKKAQVEKHYQFECRDCNELSCIDCGQDFYGEEYASHTTCISEAEKYQGKLYKPKEKQNKGEHKQQEWLKHVREATTSGAVEPRIAGLLDKISAYPNVPRKRAKFKNFCQSSVHVRDSVTLDRLWDIFSSGFKTNPQGEISGSSGESDKVAPHGDVANDHDDLDETNKNQKEKKKHKRSFNKEKHSKRKDSKKHKKEERLKDIDNAENGVQFKEKSKNQRKYANENSEDLLDVKNGKTKVKRKRTEGDGSFDESPSLSKVSKFEAEGNETTYNFKWKSVIKAVLRECDGQELPFKRLRKKVLAEFQACGANYTNLSENKIRALFDKKVHSNPNFKVRKDIVRLVK